MAAISFFDESEHGQVSGSSFAEPDGTKHVLEMLEGNGRMIIRVRLQGAAAPVDLLLTDEQAVAFTGAAMAVLQRLGLDKDL